MKTLLTLCCFALFFSTAVVAQSYDFVLLQKKGKTIRRLFAGQYMLAGIESAGPYELLIKNVYKDSLRLMGYSTYASQTSYGGLYIDTVNRFYFSVHYTSITDFYNDRNKKFNLTGSSGTLMAAGLLGLLATGVNAAYLKEPLFTGRTPFFAAGSAALVGIGYLLLKASIKPIRIGKKYKLVYVKVNS